MSRELFKPSPVLSRRALLLWRCRSLHPDYRAEARERLHSLPEDVRKRFSALLEDYPRSDEERWRKAKVFDPVPFPFPYSHKRFTPWQKILWRFYRRWGLCFPIPPVVKNPHPTVLAWLAPRPAEALPRESASWLAIRLDLDAPADRVLSCLREEVRTAWRRHSTPRDATSNTRVEVGGVTLRSMVLFIPLGARLQTILAQAEEAFWDARKRRGINPGVRRERLDSLDFQLRVFELVHHERKTFSVTARRLNKPVSTVRDAYTAACRQIGTARPLSRKKRASERDPGPISECPDPRCRMAQRVEDFCSAHRRFIEQDEVSSLREHHVKDLAPIEKARAHGGRQPRHATLSRFESWE